MKTCNKCKVEKSISDFGLNNAIKSRVNGICKQCKVEAGQIRKFGMTTTQALEISKVCQICERDLANLTVHIDHDHKTNLVRGILCSGCNTSIGGLGDTVEGLERALRYLSNPPLLSQSITYKE